VDQAGSGGLRPAGLTALQYTALTVLERHPDMSAAQSMADMIRLRFKP
jgi:hypothetical protein